MKRILPLTCLLLLAAVALAACGDDDDDTSDAIPTGDSDNAELSAYFDERTALGDEARSAIAALDEEYPLAFEGGDVQQTKDSFAEYVVIYDDGREAHGAIDAPEEVAELHQTGYELDEIQKELNHKRLEELEDATTEEDVDAIFEVTPEVQENYDKSVANCEATEQVAADNDIEWDGHCGE